MSLDADRLHIRFEEKDLPFGPYFVGVACRWTRTKGYEKIPLSIKGDTITVGEFEGRFTSPDKSLVLLSTLDPKKYATMGPVKPEQCPGI